MSQALDDRRLRVAGGLAIAGGALLVAGLFPANGSFRLVSLPSVRWFTLITAALALGAGTCILVPRVGRVIGSGLLLGATASSSGIVVAIAINYLAYRSDYVWGVSVLLSFAGAVILVLAASLASVALARAGEVRVVPRLPADLPAWLVAMLGSAGAVVFFLYEQRFAPSGWRLVTSMWGPAMALLVPATAAVAVPRRFGAAVLAGWIGGSAALVLRGLLDDPANRGQILLFACTLLALLLVMIPFSRAAPTADVERTH